MRPKSSILLAIAGACSLLTGCSHPETKTLDLLPASTTARVEAALRVPPSPKLRLHVDLARADIAADDESEDGVVPQLEIWVHSRQGFRGHLLERRPLEYGENSEQIDLDRLAGREVLLQVVPKGIDPGNVSWRRAELESTVSSRSGVEADPARWRIEADADKPDVVLYVIDTLRADALGVYGSPTATPNIDGLARSGVRFAHAISTATWTRPATASLLTGLYPSTHGAEDRPDRLPESAFTLAERLRLLGYSTVAVVANGNLDPVWGFDQGFEFFQRPRVPDRDEQDRPRRHLHASEAHEVALREWDRRKDRGTGPVFLYVQVVDPHGPYDPPEWLLRAKRPVLGNTNPINDELNQGTRKPTPELMSSLRTLYAGEVAYSDQEFGKFLAGLGSTDDALFVLTADHGEAFQEHGFSSHGMSLYEGELDVPLILRSPRRVPAGVVVDEPVSLIDVVPTLLGLVGESTPGKVALPGEALQGAWGGNSSADSAGQPLMAELDYDGRRWESLRVGSEKLLTHLNAKRSWLFDLGSDPGEHANFLDSSSPSLAAMEAALSEIEQTAKAQRLEDPEGTLDNPVSEDTTEQLRALGYIQ